MIRSITYYCGDSICATIGGDVCVTGDSVLVALRCVFVFDSGPVLRLKPFESGRGAAGCRSQVLSFSL